MSISETSLQRQQQHNQNQITTLGDGQVFVKRTPNGTIKTVRGVVTLKESLGHLAEITDEKIMITANGYHEMNKIAGLSIITPSKLTLPTGDVVVNPYPIIDRESGSIEKVWVKKMAVGYSPIGNLVVTSSTLLYDITMYFIQDLAKKVKNNKTAGKICMKSMLTDDERKSGVFHAIQGEFGVWADYSNPDILKTIDTFIQNKLFAERKAQTICERNVMKKHPSLATVNVPAEGKKKARTSKVTVIGFCHDLSKDDLVDLAEKAHEEDGDQVSVGDKKASIIDIESNITAEDVAASAEEEESGSDYEHQNHNQGRPMF